MEPVTIIIPLYTSLAPASAAALGDMDDAAPRRHAPGAMTYDWNIEVQMQTARATLRMIKAPVPHGSAAGGLFREAHSPAAHNKVVSPIPGAVAPATLLA